MCDRIKENDPRMNDINHMLKKSNCMEENLKLNDCLKINNRDWRLCRVI